MQCKIFRLKRIRAQVWRVVPVALLIVVLILMVIGRSENSVFYSTRSFIIDSLTPIVRGIKAPVYWMKESSVNLSHWMHTYRENQILIQENLELKKWRTRALTLESENSELKKHLKYIPSPKAKFLSAEILLDEGGAFSRSFILNIGSNQGVVMGMLGFGPNSACGRIVEVGQNYSRLMPFTDYLSQIPVWVGPDKKVAFLIGDNSDKPYLQFPNEKDLPQAGDVVMTSGYLGVYPANLPLGIVAEFTDDEPRVILLDDLNKITFIRLVDFGLTQNLLNLTEESK